MLKFIARRLAAGIATLFVSSFLMYLLVSVSIRPLADLVESTAPNKAQLIAQRTAQLDLETPTVVRFFKWLGNFMQGDLGMAWRSGQSVNDQLGSAMVSTVQLVLAASVLAIVLGVGVGIVSALRQYTSFDYIITFASFLLYSLPAFWVAVLLKQWGAIRFNDFLRDPFLGSMTIAGVAIVLGLLWMLAIGGDLRRRAINFAGAAAITAGLFIYLQVSDWWLRPNINPVLLTLLGSGIAIGFTLLSTGLRDRRALGSAFTAVALGVVLYFPLQRVLYIDGFGWGWVIALGLIAAASGILIGRLWGGPDWRQSARAASLTAVSVGALTLIDQFMLYWGDYLALGVIRNRPIATVGDRTPNLDQGFWISSIDTYTHLLLPTIALMLISFASYTRYARSSMLEVMNQDYIRTARAKGLTERTVVMRHAFRNSLIPLATIVPLDLVAVFGGAIITEQVFSRPGMGQLFVKSLGNAEIEPVMAYLVVTAALAVIANIIADLIYAALDPRIRVNS
ncbi:ABC transporter permease [Rarobacter faecitabidus]|nr:ABC transporter permease [Rarobacter faecitabidus]